MVGKANMAAFVPGLPPGFGRYTHISDFTVGNLAKDVANAAKKGSGLESTFEAAAGSYRLFQSALQAIRVGTATGSIISGLLENGTSSPSNKGDSQVPFISSSTSTPLGRNDAIYRKHSNERLSAPSRPTAFLPYPLKGLRYYCADRLEPQARPALPDQMNERSLIQ